MCLIDKEHINTLIKKIGSGDNAAFTELYNGLKTPLYAFIFPLLKNRNDALDIIHETFKTVIEKSRTKMLYKNCFAWIFTIAKNKSLNFIKKKNRERPMESNILDYIDKQRTYHENDMIQALDLKQAIGYLSEFEQQLICLYYGEQLTLYELASIFKKSTKTISKYLTNAKHKLKRYLDEK